MNKENKVYKSITIIILLLIVFGVVFLGYLALTIFKEQKLFFERHEEQVKITEENLKKKMGEGFDLVRQKNMESEKRLSGKIDDIYRGITTLNEIYENILEEQKKRRVESLYADKDLAEKMEEAKLLLKEGRINHAYRMYELVAREQPENKEARFYMYYTLFLKNKSDIEEYSRIKRGFNILEREGYIRKEMLETLLYIEAEKN
ncbi:MAG: hypothetical protein FWD87_01185 [Spirochaetaceae bacterium]|nr:hypothetical protein [Spirochaetaceae bacterium]